MAVGRSDEQDVKLNGCTVVFYHYVRDAERTHAGPNGLSVAQFARQVDWLRSRHQVLDYARFEEAMNGGGRLPAASALLTFDDGLLDHYEYVLPALRERGLTGIFFLTGAALTPNPPLLNVHKAHVLRAQLGSSRFAGELRRRLRELDTAFVPSAQPLAEVYRYDGRADVAAKHLLNYELPFDVADRLLDDMFRRHLGDPAEFAAHLYLTPAMVDEMSAAGMTFGFHSERHRVLSRLTYQEQQEELSRGVRRIQDLTGQRSVPFSYPYGHVHTYNADTLRILAEAGYSMAFNTVRRPADPGLDHRYELPRFDTRDLPTPAPDEPHA